MPTAEAIKSLGKVDEFPDMPVFYTTSYIIDKITPSSMYIGREYKNEWALHLPISCLKVLKVCISLLNSLTVMGFLLTIISAIMPIHLSPPIKSCLLGKIKP